MENPKEFDGVEYLKNIFHIKDQKKCVHKWNIRKNGGFICEHCKLINSPKKS